MRAAERRNPGLLKSHQGKYTIEVIMAGEWRIVRRSLPYVTFFQESGRRERAERSGALPRTTSEKSACGLALRRAK